MELEKPIINDYERSAEILDYESFMNLARKEEYAAKLKNYFISTPTIIESSLKIKLQGALV